jgi:aryl-alcohol dehydrogenase-like predicted oxidoreductase
VRWPARLGYDSSRMSLAISAFGATSLDVSRLGLGCGGIGEARVTDGEAERLVHAAVDLGVTFFDTARSYGLAEERLGRALGPRRSRVVLSTKGGYGATGCDEWTGACITLGIDEALSRLRTDHIDVFHLHSCPLDVLQRGDLHDALARAREAGKIRVAAYSGDNEALAWAVDCATFGAVQCSVNAFDQHALRSTLPRAASRSLGVVAKRPLGNAPWRFSERPAAADVAASWDRMRAMALDPSPLTWEELALRFTAFAPPVGCAVVGTTRVEHLSAAARAVDAGPLAEDIVRRVTGAFDAVGSSWPGLV